MIKLALSDLDNTLIPLGANAASTRIMRAIHSCLDAGVRFGPVTGRNRTETAGFLCHDAACYETGVFVNGAQVVLDGELISETILIPHELDHLAGIIATRPRCALIVFRPDGHADWVGDDPETLGRIYHEGMREGASRQRSLPSYPVTKAGIIANLERHDELALQAELADAIPGLDFLNTVHTWFDVMPHGLNKASGVDVLRKALGIGLDEICVFGDAENDLALFDAVVHSCAVANATPAASDRARWHIGASAEDGVAIALEQIAQAAREGVMPVFMAG